MSEIFKLSRLSWDAHLNKFALQAFWAEQADGTIPKHRADPSGDETVIWAGSSHEPTGLALIYECAPKRLWLDFLWVRPSLRRMGVGKALMHAVRIHAVDHGFERIELGTKVENHPMHRLAVSQNYCDEAFVMVAQLRSYL